MAVEAISAERLMGHVERFSRISKPAGSAGELASFHDLRAEMDALGFTTELILHDAYISLPGAASIEVGGERPACITHSFSIATSGVTGAIIDIGEGTPADFVGRDLEGFILLVAGIASPEVSARASAAGAVGQIHVSPHEHLHEMCVSPVWGSPSPDQLHELPRTAIVTIGAITGRRMNPAPNPTMSATSTMMMIVLPCIMVSWPLYLLRLLSFPPPMRDGRQRIAADDKI